MTYENKISLFPINLKITGDVTLNKIKRSFFLYSLVYISGLLLYSYSSNFPLKSAGLSLILPGAGLLADPYTGSLFFFLIFSCFSFSIFLWFATGNIILPPLIWIASIFLTFAYFTNYSLPTPIENRTPLFIPPLLIGITIFIFKFNFHFNRSHRKKLNQYISTHSNQMHLYQSKEHNNENELTLSDLKHFRLFLDRALQPVEDFNGFEQLDQFQTAAIRYQINFISYAISCTQYEYFPAFSGYIEQAQRNLHRKQENYKTWKYWKLENIWGNLNSNPNPVIQDNIMYSGFLAAQIAYGLQSDQNKTEIQNVINCTHPNGMQYHYTYTELIEILVRQYKFSDFGLLPCEPNWIYPLCNIITATAIHAHDNLYKTSYWNEIKDKFRHSLETEFITTTGKFIPFRSAYTGFSPPQIGGTVMQAFPCFFLNATLPDIANRQWLALKFELENKDWKKSLWPIDVGNYNFSRASSYAATALAAREMGDHTIADMLLEKLDQEHPIITQNEISYRKNSSLWANANAFMAKTNKRNTLQKMVCKPQKDIKQPTLASTEYSEFSVAKAINKNNVLQLVLYPTNKPCIKKLTIENLIPDTLYSVTTDHSALFRSDHDGIAKIEIALNGRTALAIGKA